MSRLVVGTGSNTVSLRAPIPVYGAVEITFRQLIELALIREARRDLLNPSLSYHRVKCLVASGPNYQFRYCSLESLFKEARLLLLDTKKGDPSLYR